MSSTSTETIESAPATGSGRLSYLITQPIIPTLFRLAAPNALGFFVMSSVTIAEMWYVGQLGTHALAGLAMAFPLVMLMQMLSNGSIGGVVAATVARAMGAGDVHRANGIVWQALGLGLFMGALFSCLFLLFGGWIFQKMGGHGDSLVQALSYGRIVFIFIIGMWVFNMLGSLLRGAGDMKTPAMSMMVVAAIQVCLSGALSLGWFGLPAMGISGIGWATAVAQVFGILIVFRQVKSGRSGIQFFASALEWNPSITKEILKNGYIAAINPFLTIASILFLTAFISRFGVSAVAGFGIGTRLEFVLIPIVFGFGAAMISLVGSNIGAGKVSRAEKVGWSGGILSAVICGAIGAVVAMVPGLWAGMFSDDPAVLAVAYDYLLIVGPSYAFFGLGLSLYFAAQGAHALAWPVVANCLRLLVSVGGGWMAISIWPTEHMALLYLIAASLVVYGTITAASLFFGAWQRANPAVS